MPIFSFIIISVIYGIFIVLVRPYLLVVVQVKAEYHILCL